MPVAQTSSVGDTPAAWLAGTVSHGDTPDSGPAAGRVRQAIPGDRRSSHRPGRFPVLVRLPPCSTRSARTSMPQARRRRWNTTCATSAGTDGRTAVRRHDRRRRRPAAVDTYINEFWTSRAACRALAARGVLPRLLQAAAAPLLHRAPDPARRRRLRPVHGPRHDGARGGAAAAGVRLGNDVNPLSRMLVEPRLRPPVLAAVRERLTAIDWTFDDDLPRRPADVLPPRDAARDLRTASSISTSARARTHSTTSTAGYAWSRSTG